MTKVLRAHLPCNLATREFAIRWRWPVELHAAVMVRAGGLLLLAVSGCFCQRPMSTQKTVPVTTIPNPYVIEITGSNKNWYARYPDETVTSDLTGKKSLSADEKIHLPLGTRVVLLLKSTDYVYTFSIPEKKLKEIAVPTLEYRIEFEPTEPAEFDLIGEPLCGEPHSQTASRLVIEPCERFLEWRQSRLAAK